MRIRCLYSFFLLTLISMMRDAHGLPESIKCSSNPTETCLAGVHVYNAIMADDSATDDLAKKVTFLQNEVVNDPMYTQAVAFLTGDKAECYVANNCNIGNEGSFCTTINALVGAYNALTADLQKYQPDLLALSQSILTLAGNNDTLRSLRQTEGVSALFTLVKDLNNFYPAVNNAYQAQLPNCSATPLRTDSKRPSSSVRSLVPAPSVPTTPQKGATSPKK